MRVRCLVPLAMKVSGGGDAARERLIPGKGETFSPSQRGREERGGAGKRERKRDTKREETRERKRAREIERARAREREREKERKRERSESKREQERERERVRERENQRDRERDLSAQTSLSSRRQGGSVIAATSSISNKLLHCCRSCFTRIAEGSPQSAAAGRASLAGLLLMLMLLLMLLLAVAAEFVWHVAGMR